MQLDAVTIAVIAGVVAVLLIATAVSRRREVDGPGNRGPFSSSTESQAGFAALGTINPAAYRDDDPGHHRGHDHGGDSGEHEGGHSHGGAADGGHSHGDDAGGGDAGGGDGGGGGED